MNEQSPKGVSTRGKIVWTVIVILSAIALTWAGALLWTAYAARNAQFVLGPQGLRIRASLYGRSIPREELLVHDAQLVSFDLHASRLSPARRINGMEVPGYKEGWFRLADGRTALACVTRRDPVVLVPTTREYVVLLSPVRPEMFLAALQGGGAVTQTFAIVPSAMGAGLFTLLAVMVLAGGAVVIRLILWYAARWGQRRQ